MYQGHLPDSPIQRHSAGPTFPFIVGARQRGDSLTYFVLLPNGTEIEYPTYDSEIEYPTYDSAYADALQYAELRLERTKRIAEHRAAYELAAPNH